MVAESSAERPYSESQRLNEILLSSLDVRIFQRIWSWNGSVPAAEAKKADGASLKTLRTPRPSDQTEGWPVTIGHLWETDCRFSWWLDATLRQNYYYYYYYYYYLLLLFIIIIIIIIVVVQGCVAPDKCIDRCQLVIRPTEIILVKWADR